MDWCQSGVLTCPKLMHSFGTNEEESYQVSLTPIFIAAAVLKVCGICAQSTAASEAIKSA